MTVEAGAASSPAPPKELSPSEAVEWYRTNYAQIEEELREYQATSKEVEAELERDVEALEEEQRVLKEKAENLQYEVDEWKGKHKQAKEEANRAQNVLQKEITTLRDTNRALTMKLRDIEVANDDFEKQARHQTSSLEDMESKYNVAIERGVMLEEEIKNGEQERENLRIDAQRLRDELSDLKVEAEITQEKLRSAEASIERLHANRKPSALATESLRAPSPASETSTSATTVSSPTIATPPQSKSETSTVQTSPPSPPLSETSTTKPRLIPITPAKQRTLEPGTTPRPLHSGIRAPRHSRGPSVPNATSALRPTGPTSAVATRRTTRPSISGGRQSISALPQPTATPNNTRQTFDKMRGLHTKMADLQERVHRARSKLPGPTTTPPRASPRAAGGVDGNIPSSITVRSSRKRASAASTAGPGGMDTPSGGSRLSFGFNADRDRDKHGSLSSRPSSRASITSGVPRPSSRASGIGLARPPSQTGMRTGSSLGYHPTSSTTISGVTERRPRSSISGSYSAMHSGRETPSTLEHSRAATPSSSRYGYQSDIDHSIAEGDDADGGITPTITRRTTMDKSGITGIPMPGVSVRRQSARRESLATDGGGGSQGDMGPPARRDRRTDVDVGETF